MSHFIIKRRLLWLIFWEEYIPHALKNRMIKSNDLEAVVYRKVEALQIFCGDTEGSIFMLLTWEFL